MPDNSWSAYFSLYQKFLFSYVVGRHSSILLTVDLENKTKEKWSMPYYPVENGLSLYPTMSALFIDISYPEELCRISYKHELKKKYNDATSENVMKWEVVSTSNLPGG